MIKEYKAPALKHQTGLNKEEDLQNIAYTFILSFYILYLMSRLQGF